jgi:predicted dehydrogenase/threonine dehydrogenase-like Zn-dependent dehydrogenase
VETGEKSLLQKALARPDLVRQVFDYARQNGVMAAVRRVQARLDTLATMGYSAAGVVLEVGEGVHEFRPGDRVAVGGGGYANHCSVNFVPQNLAVRVPDAVPLDAASLTTIGAIALQGVRQARVQVGETVAVIGAGLIGILTIQIARAAGCRVIGIDKDPQRAARAAGWGAHLTLASDDARLAARAREFSRYGPDAAIITAASRTAEPLELASRILRDRGRIVVVGDVGLGVSRSDVYAKEASIVMSRSYGPGRYDPQYEELGHDYPVGYVRWTEKRNMEAFLDLIAQGSVDLRQLLECRYPVSQGDQAYAAIRQQGIYTAIIEYGCESERPGVASDGDARRNGRAVTDKLRVGCIGAGGFARTVIIPVLKARKDVALESVATLTGTGAESARRAFGFRRTQTSDQLLQSREVDAVFVASRHDSHARHVAAAIAAGKAVFVEKPLAVSREDMRLVRDAYRTAHANNGTPFVMVGFNRRFAPATERICDFFAGRREAMLIQIRINAGFVPRGHWVHESGGRMAGEMCHFIDWARAVVGRNITGVYAAALPDGARYQGDNVAAMLSFADGSLASLLYLANGDRSVPKEHYEVFCEGGVARLDDFSTLELSRDGKTRKTGCGRDKGHTRELELTIESMRALRAAPIPFEELLEVTEATLLLGESAASGARKPLALVHDLEPVGETISQEDGCSSQAGD